MRKYLLVLLAVGVLGFGGAASAHQPRLVDSQVLINVLEPEISKAYYGELAGQTTIYRFNSAQPFNLYLNLLVPKMADVQPNLSATVKADGRQIAKLDGVNLEWQEFYEPFGGDYYRQGPEYTARVPAGEYLVEISRPGNSGKYVLAVGQAESFPFSEIMKTLWVMPRLKHEFFGYSIWQLIWSRVGIIYAVPFLLLVVGVYLAWRRRSGVTTHRFK